MIYLDNAATSFPKPNCVISNVSTALKFIGGNPGRSGHRMSLTAGKMVLYTRCKLAEFFGTDDPFEYIFTSNCTEALNLAIRGSLKNGDHVITTAVEHNSVYRVLYSIQSERNIKISIVQPDKNGIINPSDISEEIRSNTKLIIMSHVSNVTGAIQPVEEVCRICSQKGVLSLIDGAQAAGYVPTEISVIKPDMYAFPGHKGLLGPQGTGGLYLKNGIELTPLKTGGTGSQSLLLTQPPERPERYESGTMNVPALAGLAAGIDFIIKNKSRIWASEQAISSYIINALSSMNGITLYSPTVPGQHTGVAAFNIGALDSGYVADILDKKFDIYCRAGLHCAPLIHQFFNTTEQGMVRASIGYSTTPEDARDFIIAVTKILQMPENF